MKPTPHTSEKKSLKDRLSAIVLCGPMTAWSLLFIVVPIVILAVMSFMTKGALGVIVQSLIIAGWTTGLTILLGYPFATAMARMRARTSGVMMVLLMIPMWVSGLVIIYSFVILLNHSGIINTFLMHIGLIKSPKSMLYTNFSVICGMLYMFLPFAVLPMYSSIEKLDYNLVEASQDLGASPVRTFFKVTLPLTSPGIFAAVILTFIPCVGYYMVTDMLGGGTSMLIGNLIDRQFTIARNWPFGAALSMVLAIVIFAMVGIYTKLGGNLDDLG